MRTGGGEAEEGRGYLETEAWQDELETRGLQHKPASVVTLRFI